MIAAKIIAEARKHIGKSGEQFWRAYGYSTRVPWCAIFQWFLFHALGADSLYYGGKKTAYVPALWSAAKSAGMTSRDPRPGDLVCYDWNKNNAPDHVGLVVSVTGSTIHTIEGNVSDKVAELDRPRDERIMGYIHPAYSAETGDCDNCPIMEALRGLYNKLKEEDK